MPILFDAPVSPDDATAFAREVPVTLPFSTLFPVETVDDNTYDFSRITRVNRTARYRTFDGRVHVTERDSGSSARVRLTPLSVASPADGEYDQMQLAFARTGGTAQTALVNAIYNDAEQLVREVRNRVEQGWGDVLADGILSINENGLQAEADYGVPTDHKVNVTGTTNVWTNTAAPILDRLTDWAATYETTNGATPGALRVTPWALRHMRRNTQLINAVAGAAAGRSQINLNELQQALDSEGLPLLQVMRPATLDVDGTPTKTLADDLVMFTPADDDMGLLGATVFGVTSTALDLVNDSRSTLEFEDAAGVVAMVFEEGFPPRKSVFADAVGQPILKDGRRLFVADVA